MLVIFEGLDGVGKTTISSGVYEKLKEIHGDNVVLFPILKPSDKPEDVEISEGEYKRFKAREMSKEEVANYLQKVIEHNSKEVIRLSAQGKIVITDRHIPSFYSYQVCNETNPCFQKAFATLSNTNIFPDNSIIFHILADKKIVEERLAIRGKDGYDNFVLENYETMENNYRKYYTIHKPKTVNHSFVYNEDRDPKHTIKVIVDTIETFNG